MDQEHPKRLRTSLNLDEKQKQTVRALRRQISSHSTGSSTTEGDYVAKLSEEEVLILRKVVQTLTTYKADSDLIGDEVDNRRVDRNWSVESYLSSSRGSGTFVNPARFYVRVKKEEVRALEQVCLELDDEESNTKPSWNGYRHFNSNSLSSNNYENKYKPYYGYSVALTKQNEQPIVTTKAAVTEVSPEGVTKFSFGNGSVNKAGHRSKLRHLPPRERFRRAVYLVMDNLKMRPRKMDTDFSELWCKRGNATWLAIFFSVVAIGAFFADIGTDLKVAADHFTAGSNWWGSFTVMLVLLPSVITNLVSFFWYKEDEQIGRRPKSGWKTVSITHFFLVGLIERYVMYKE